MDKWANEQMTTTILQLLQDAYLIKITHQCPNLKKRLQYASVGVDITEYEVHIRKRK